MPGVIMTPKQAGDLLGVSGTALRRASGVYEEVFGELKRDARGGREFTPEAVERLRLAFEAVHAGRVASVGVALALLKEGDELPVPLDPPAPRAGDAEALARAVVGELVAELRGDLQAIREENAALRGEVAALRAALEPDRLRVVLHAVTDLPAAPPVLAPSVTATLPAPPAPPGGLLGWLLHSLRGRR